MSIWKTATILAPADACARAYRSLPINPCSSALNKAKRSVRAGLWPANIIAHELGNEQNRGNAAPIVIHAGRIVYGGIIGAAEGAGRGRIEMRSDENDFVAFSR